jgi:peroxiredoxin
MMPATRSWLRYLYALLVIGLAADVVWVNIQNHQLRLKSSDAIATSMGMPSVRLGSHAPPFDLASVDGRRYRLTDFHGTRLTIVYFATDCGECERQAPQWRCLYEGREDRRAAFLGVVKGTRHDVQVFAKQHRLPFPVVVDTGAFAHAYGIDATPTLLEIDGQGAIVSWSSVARGQ